MTSTKENAEISVVSSILRNEFTWWAAVLIAGWAFVTQVILPIQSLQINQTAILQTLQDEKNTYAQMTADTQEVKNMQLKQEGTIANMQLQINHINSKLNINQ